MENANEAFSSDRCAQEPPPGQTAHGQRGSTLRPVLAQEAEPVSRLALVYVRQSDPRPGERSVSLEVQEQACCELPGVKACVEDRSFRDAGISRGSTTR